MRKLYLLFLLLIFSFNLAFSQQKITLNECQDLAKENFPLSKQLNLIDQTTKATIEVLMGQYFPQFRLGAQASYQSDVTKIELNTPENFPKIDIPIPEKDQYKVFLDASQIIFGGGSLGVQQLQTHAEAKIQKQQIEVELYKLRDQINQLYFGVLLADEQLKQIDILKNDLSNAYENVSVSVKNGVLLEANQLSLEAELITIQQQIDFIKISRSNLVKVMEKLIGKTLSENTEFEKPIFQTATSIINRPEITLIDLQKSNLNLQNRQLAAQNVPEISLFLQGGYGKPALNMFKNTFETYYIGGVRFNWNISRLYTIIRERRNIDTRLKMYDIEKDIFTLNNEIAKTKQKSKIKQLELSIQQDEKLISLRKKIKETVQFQLENGTITSSEFIREANAENKARQIKTLHEIELIAAKYELQWIFPQ